eukprot:scaffold106145_cov67-Cyclotella_meneghiniana.AAC.2
MQEPGDRLTREVRDAFGAKNKLRETSLIPTSKAVTGLRAGSMGRSKAGTALRPSHWNIVISSQWRQPYLAQSAKD